MSSVAHPESWRRAYVLGLGLSGRAAARLLRAHGVEVVASDRRAKAELGDERAVGELVDDAGVELRLGRDDVELPGGVDALVVSPGVAATHPILAAARRLRVPILAEVELAFRMLDPEHGSVVAITGSNGKSTTTAMTGALLAGAGFAVEVCGNIGVPLASVVDGAPGRLFVVELSSFQLETIDSFRPRAAALLNLSPDHLDRHGDLAGYLAAKRNIFRNQTAEDVAVLNADEAEIAATPVAARRRFFSRAGAVVDGCFLDGDTVVERAPGATDTRLFDVADLSVPGPHNLENAMAAALLARAMGASAAALPKALKEFRGLPHRMARVGERGGVAYYDDSKGTNVAATARSLEGFADGTVHLILGGRNKGADFAFLRDVVRRKAKRLYLIGESAGALERELGDLVPAERSDTLAAAVRGAAHAAAAGDAVVLSPACASFDQFEDYVDRGRSFQRLVSAELAAPPGAPIEASHG
jgi:UDP-N-acetylmuramoylalanine--D-glutamate ligase